MAERITLFNLSTNIFVIKSYQIFISDEEFRRLTDLHDAARNALELIRQRTERFDEKNLKRTLPGKEVPMKTTSYSETSSTLNPSTTSEIILSPLILACLSGNARLCSIALDCLQKLIAYGGREVINPWFSRIENTEEEQSAEKGVSKIAHYPIPDDDRRFPMALHILNSQLIDLICDCFIDELTDDQVQLHIIKALLTAVSAEYCYIRGPALERTIRTLYNMILLSRSVINQHTARGALCQTIEIVFQRLVSQNFTKADPYTQTISDSTFLDSECPTSSSKTHSADDKTMVEISLIDEATLLTKHSEPDSIRSDEFTSHLQSSQSGKSYCMRSATIEIPIFNGDRSSIFIRRSSQDKFSNRERINDRS